jgi:hypothetical protein
METSGRPHAPAPLTLQKYPQVPKLLRISAYHHFTATRANVRRFRRIAKSYY